MPYIVLNQSVEVDCETENILETHEGVRSLTAEDCSRIVSSFMLKTMERLLDFELRNTIDQNLLSESQHTKHIKRAIKGENHKVR